MLDIRGRPPILLLTVPEPDNMRFLCHLPVEDLAWASEPVEEVLARGLRLVRGTERRRVAECLLRSCSDHATVERIVRKLFFDPKPPSQVQDLANACFLSRRSLARKWRAAWPDAAPISLKALVNWALALRARELSQSGLASLEAAKALGIHKRTLERTVGRLAGLTWGRWSTSEGEVGWRRVTGAFTNDYEN
ncbi:MAG: hypothetical protein HKO65_07925 [Gemmatimonadetes bacterium]|nr:hypothetical protein [Gemmatimonadota bacterium]